MSRLQPIILCIDHHWSRLVERKQLLEASGYAVIDAIDGAEALKLFRTSAVDAVVLHYQLPGMNGDVLAARIKRTRPHVPIVLLSTYGPLPDNKLESVDVFLTTSQEPKFLVSTLGRLLTNRTKPFFHRWFAQWTGRNAGVRP
jgi:CheY-like chemotaxis protein